MSQGFDHHSRHNRCRLIYWTGGRTAARLDNRRRRRFDSWWCRKDWIRGGDGSDLLAGGSEADRQRDRRRGRRSARLHHRLCGARFGRHRPRPDRFSRIDADTTAAADDAFHFIGTDEFTGVAGELRAVAGTTLVTDPDPIYGDDPYDADTILVEGDIDVDGAADFQLAVLGTTQLRAGDFYL
jgi:hypothetical protein